MLLQNNYSFNKYSSSTSKLLNKNNLPQIGFSSFGLISRIKLKDIPFKKELIFDSFTGLLRPGIYQMSLDEIKMHKILGGNKERQELITQLQNTVKLYKSAGIEDIYLGGSFTSTAKTPYDIDGFFIFNNKQFENLKKVDKKYSQPQIHQAKTVYGMDFVPCPKSNVDNMASFFSNNNLRGLIKIV